MCASGVARGQHDVMGCVFEALEVVHGEGAVGQQQGGEQRVVRPHDAVGGDMDKAKALEAALAQIDRAFGKGSVMKLGKNDRSMDIGHEAEPESLEDSEMDQEQIVRQKR